jgi:hypothetical protein
LGLSSNGVPKILTTLENKRTLDVIPLQDLPDRVSKESNFQQHITGKQHTKLLRPQIRNAAVLLQGK